MASDKPQFSPKKFMQMRRPERFSDSIRRETKQLDRSFLEFQLATLNRRNQELAFEDFAKKLCEKVICPNLLEQTGPVAGGDGKVDTQNFPVSEQGKLRWYTGINENADSERWAFAVSTQQDWKTKCRTDVRKIKGTDRGYVKAFCVSNQYAKGDQRSKVEDDLARETGIDVRVLDLSWILDQIFRNGLEELAIDCLGIEVEWRREVQTGTLDYARQTRLQEIEGHISKQLDVSNISSEEVSEFLEAAILSQELENPEIDTRGRFDRAVKVAEQFGTIFQQFKAHYRYAWAAFWWFESFELFKTEFMACLSIARSIEHASQWGDVVNLLGLYSGALRYKGEVPDYEFLAVSEDIRQRLESIAAMDDRPSNSLMGEAYLQVLNLHFIETVDDADPVFSALLKVFKQGEKLVGFAHSELYDLIIELDEVFGEKSSYEDLLDYVTESYSNREGRSREALLWLKRGTRRLESGQPYQAIKLIGKSLVGLYQKDHQNNLYVALNALAVSYTQVGLFWAARANYLMASSLVTNAYWTSGEFRPGQALSYLRLARLELRLGRVVFALAWWQMALIVSNQLNEDVIEVDDRQSFDAFLTQIFLHSDHRLLSSIPKLPDRLEAFGLVVSESSLLHQLGYEELAREQVKTSAEEINDFFLLLRDTDLGAEVPEIELLASKYPSLKTSILGCKIEVAFPYKTPFIELAETILAGLEAILATTVVDGVVIVERKVVIEISSDDDDEVLISHEINASEKTLTFEVLCSSFSANKLNVDAQGVIQHWLGGFLVDFIARIMLPKDTTSTLESMFAEDRVLDRAVSFSSGFSALYNVFGDEAVDTMLSTLNEPKDREFPLIRKEKWDANSPPPAVTKTRVDDSTPGKEAPSAELYDPERIKHSEFRQQGLINVRLWDRANWNGVAFASGGGAPPLLALMLENETAGEQIFEELVELVGQHDPDNRLRISIIRGISKSEPHAYRVLITENFDAEEGSMVMLSTRINSMYPKSSDNLKRFLAGYQEAGSYAFSFGVLEDGGLRAPRRGEGITIHKQALSVLDAWTIGINTIESVAIRRDDAPIIPPEEDDPPVLGVLDRLKRLG